MDAVLKWAGIVGAIWLAVSILVAVFWAAVGRTIVRRPTPPPMQTWTTRDADSIDVEHVVSEVTRRDQLNGGL